MSAADVRSPGRAWLVFAAKIVFSVALLAFVISRIPLDQLAETLAQARPEWLAAAFLMLLVSNILGAWQWNRLMRAVAIEIPFWKVLAYYHVGLFFNNFLPANVGGDIARVMDAARYGSGKTHALSTVLLDRLIGTVALAGLAVVTTVPAIDRFHLGAVYLALVGFFVLSVSVLWLVFRPGLLPRLEGLLSRVGLGRLRGALDDLAARLQVFRGQRRLLLALLALAVVVQVMRVGVHVCVARALGLSVAIPYFFLFVPLLAVIVSLPISLNGIGVREGAGVVLFGLVGVDRAPAFSLQFTTYLVAVAVSLLGGLVFLVRIPRRRAEQRTARRTS
jgi:uncharacterized protein (TIRG00374 family)